MAVRELLPPDEFAPWIAENVKGVTDEMMQALITMATETMADDAQPSAISRPNQSSSDGSPTARNRNNTVMPTSGCRRG
jgi:hypothetical protein